MDGQFHVVFLNEKHTDVEATWFEKADHKAYPKCFYKRGRLSNDS